MKNRVKNIVNEIVLILRTWNNVKAVVLQHFVERDVYDPNFSISLDVFRDGDIPDRKERNKLFTNAEYFETSFREGKDRFMWKELPVRISYKDCHRVDAVLNEVYGKKWLSMERGTYLFHRIATGAIEWCQGDWMHNVLAKLDNLPDTFWSTWIESCNNRIDHLIGDMGSAVINEDNLYFNLSLSAFLRTFVEFLCAINHVFKPGIRDYSGTLALLELRPDGFEAQWESLLRDDPDLPPERKQELAALLSRAAFALIN